MNQIDLLGPILRDIELTHIEFAYPIIHREYLPVPSYATNPGFFSVLRTRQTRREFGPLSQEKLSALLWYAAKTRSGYREKTRYIWQHRPAPSAGGRHPVDLLISPVAAHDHVYQYDSVGHSLCELQHSDDDALRLLLRAIDEVVPIGNSTILWFAAQFGRTLSKYENGESLVWRDAGALLATVSLVAEALRLNMCPLGIHGEPWISRLLGSQGKVIGVGGCLVGDRLP